MSSQLKYDLFYKAACRDEFQAVYDREVQDMRGASIYFAEKLNAYSFEELLDLEKKADPSLSYLKLWLNRQIIHKMKMELETGMRLLDG